MPTVADCLRQHGDAFLKSADSTPSSAGRLTLQQRKVLAAIRRCRTGELGHVLYQCGGCGREHWVGRSCGNRHCPGCQHEKTQIWLRKQSDHLLPVHHFLVTFTVPEELRSLLRAQPKEGYNAIFAAGSETIRELLTNPKYLGTADVGFFGVLHTWGRDPTVFHPHVHFVVAGGGVSADGTKWLATRENFLFPEKCASVIYRQKFREWLRAAGLEDSVDPAVWHGWWEVNVKPVGDGQAVLKYLAPYVHRVAISDNRIEHCDERSVRFRYTPSKSKTSRTRTVTGHEFVRGFLQHVLPKGFQKVRHYGWMSSNSRRKLANVRWLVWLYRGWTYWLGSGHAPQPDKPPCKLLRCSHCGGDLILIAIVLPTFCIVVSPAVPYLDTG